MASIVLLCTLMMLISSTVTGFYSLSISARDNPEGAEQSALDPLNREQRLADDCTCVTGICIFVKTSDSTIAGTNDPYCIEFEAHGQTFKHTLDDIPEPGKSTLWELDLKKDFNVPNICIKLKDISKLVIYKKMMGLDGWQVHSISTAAKTCTGPEPLSVDRPVNKWVFTTPFELNLVNTNNSTSCD